MKNLIVFLCCLSLSYHVIGQQLLYDDANILSLGQRDQVNNKLKAIKVQTGVDIRCVIPTSLNGKSPDQFTLEKGDALKVGTIGINNGIILMVAPKEEQFYIAASYGVQWQLTEKEINSMIDAVLGKFKGKHYANGILVCLEQIEKELTGINFSVSEASIQTTDFTKMVGKCVAFEYDGTTSSGNFRMPSASSNQFDPSFKVELKSNGNKRGNLFYDQNMGTLVSELITSKKILIFARVRKAVPLEFELLGTMRY